MDIEFYGANCLTLTTKHARVVVDDNLEDLSAKSVTRDGDVALFTQHYSSPKASVKLIIDGPGEFEVSGVSVLGLSARSFTDEQNKMSATIYKLTIDELRLVVVGHIYPELSESQLETLGRVDILCIPVGNNGYTLDGAGALKLIKQIEPKIIVPTHYEDKLLTFPVPQQSVEEALKTIGMEIRETVPKLRVKTADLTDVSQFVVVTKS